MPSALFIDTIERSVYGGNYRFLDFIEQVRAYAVRFRDEVYARYGVMRTDYSYAVAQIGDEDVEVRPEQVEIKTGDLVFSVARPYISESMVQSAPGVAGLLVFCLIFSIWGFIGFVRADVR